MGEEAMFKYQSNLDNFTSTFLQLYNKLDIFSEVVYI